MFGFAERAFSSRVQAQFDACNAKDLDALMATYALVVDGRIARASFATGEKRLG